MNVITWRKYQIDNRICYEGKIEGKYWYDITMHSNCIRMTYTRFAGNPDNIIPIYYKFDSDISLKSVKALCELNAQNIDSSLILKYKDVKFYELSESSSKLIEDTNKLIKELKKPRRLAEIKTEKQIDEEYVEGIKRYYEQKQLIIELRKYEKYVGCYVKRFYNKFIEENIFKILEYRVNKYGIPEFLYCNDNEQWWSDIEDSMIITEEWPIEEDDRVISVHSLEYNHDWHNPY